MANNKSIQILRGTNANIVASDETLLPGQPLYNLTKGYLTIGGGGANGDESTPLTSKPIVVRELVGYLEDDLAGNISSGNTIAYQIKGNRGGLDIIENEGLINIQGTGANIVMGSGNMNVQSSSINISTQAYGGGGTLSLSSISSGLDGGHRLYVSADYLNMGGRIETYLNCAHSTLSIKGSSIALNTLGQIDITSNGGINLNSTSSIVLGYVADRTTSNVPMAGVNLTSSGVSLYTGTNNYGDTGSARINTYMNISSNGVTINQSGNIITFPKKRGTIALDSDALHRHNIEITGAGIYAVWKLFITMYYSSSTPFTSIVSLGSALAGPMYGEGGWLMSCHGYNPSSPSFAIIGVGYKSSVEPSGITLMCRSTSSSSSSIVNVYTNVGWGTSDISSIKDIVT